MKTDDAARDAAEYDECEHGVPGGNDCVDCMKRAHADEIRALNEEAEALATERDEARKMLAECYVLSGADPDGDDWRHLWQTAVAEVRQTMEEHRAEVEDLVAERDEARAELALLRASLSVPERYVGIVSEAVAAELEREQALRCEAVKTADNLRAELTAIRAALGNGADEAAWRPGETLAEAVGRLRGEHHSLRDVLQWVNDQCPGKCSAVCDSALRASHEGPHAEALGDNGGPNGW